MSVLLDKKLDFFNSMLKNTELSKDGVNLLIWCPFCKHKNKKKLKLSIHLEKNFFHCWLCDKKGSNINYLVSLIDRNKVKESESLFKKYTKQKWSLFEDEEVFEKKEVFLPNDFKFLAEDFDYPDPDARDILKYAIQRGADKHKVWMLRLGFSLDNEFRRYLIIPSYDANGLLNFYTARKIDADTGFAFKYKNADIPKKNIVFNELNICWDEPLTIVEGPLDLLKTNDNATCLLGSSLNEEMLLFQKIVENRTPVKLALDSDVYNKTLSIARKLSEYDISVDILDTRCAPDVGDMTKNQFNKIYENANTFSEKDILLNKIRSL